MSIGQLGRQERRRALVASLRVLAITAAVVASYLLLPLTALADYPVELVLAGGLLVLAAATMLQLRAVARSRRPVSRAVEALAATIPLYLLLFAAVYFVVARADGQSFTEQPLTRLDTAYFTVTVFATVGFGDIAPDTQLARGLVTVQMVLNLIVVGAVVRLFIATVKAARERVPPTAGANPAVGPAGPPPPGDR